LHFSPPALALLELESLSRGLVVADVLLKRAVVTLSRSEAVSPGKHILIFSGGVAEVEESFSAGLAAGQGLVIDSLLLPQVAAGLIEGLKNSFATRALDESLGFVETNSVAGALKAADVALKSAHVRLTAIHLAKGIGGKGFFSVCGAQHDVEEALERAAQCLDRRVLVAAEIIQRPHSSL
jgi:microcompartment protein CcmL/EutN